MFQRLNGEELALLRESVASLLSGGGSVDEAQAMGLMSFCRSADDAGLTAAVTVAEEAGRSASRLAVHVAVAANLAQLWQVGGKTVRGEGRVAFAQAQFGGERGGHAVVSDGRLTGRLRFVDGLPADRLMVATAQGFALVATAAPGLSQTATPGLGGDPLHDLSVADVPCEALILPEGGRDDVMLVLRLLLAARARGAVERAFALAVDHVKMRCQFGQPLGRFQAMQHKLADCHLLLAASGEMARTAVDAFDLGTPDWRHFALAAAAFDGAALRRAMFEVQHGFGAIGYAEEHEVARHFRRVHADLARMGGTRSARRALAGMLAERGGRLPALTLGADAEAYRADVRAWLDAAMTEDLRQAEAAKPFSSRGWNPEFAAAMGAAGLIGIAWPKAAGGGARSPLEQLAYVEEFTRADAPMTSQSAASWIAGPEIIRHGSDRLRAELLPAILRGEASVCLGYSEPEAGSDLAALRTRAVRQGDHYRISGQKLWGTGTDKATHVLLAARTGGEDKPRHKGISLFVVPLASPGITIVPEMALYGHSFSTQYYDDVVVPADCRLGEENGGWAILGGTLASERILMGGSVSRLRFLFEAMFAEVAKDEVLATDAVLRDGLACFAAEIEAARQLSLRAVRMLERGGVPLVEGAMAKLFTGDLGERFTSFAMDALGSSATLGEESADVPLAGRIEQELRRAPMGVIGGGAAEVQKTIIAQRGLGLPR